MKNQILLSFLFFLSLVVNAQIQSISLTSDGSITITPQGLTSAKTDTAHYRTNVALGPNTLEKKPG